LGFNQRFYSNVLRTLVGGQEELPVAQQDRVDVLKKYADYSWVRPNHYVIFEHLGGNSEEQQWANYRLNESPVKGL
jgi:hypothetical protein